MKDATAETVAVSVGSAAVTTVEPQGVEYWCEDRRRWVDAITERRGEYWMIVGDMPTSADDGVSGSV